VSILDQISKMRGRGCIGGGDGGGGGGGSCIVCDTVCSSSLLCREKWHGHFTWGVDFKVDHFNTTCNIKQPSDLPQASCYN
jgi:hypothetical protein